MCPNGEITSPQFDKINNDKLSCKYVLIPLKTPGELFLSKYVANTYLLKNNSLDIDNVAMSFYNKNIL